MYKCEERYENISQIVDEKEHNINKMSFKKGENKEILDAYSFLGFYVPHFVYFYITDCC